MRKILDRWTGPVPAAWLCWVLALGAVVLAFIGAERAGVWMARPVMQVGVALLTLVFFFIGVCVML